MGLINLLSTVPNYAVKMSSSIFSSGSAINFISAAVGSDSIVSIIFTFLAKAFYFVAKWMLYLLDIIFSYVQQLCGLNMSFESLDKMVSKESDFVFNLLLTATDTITPIIRSLIGLAVGLIIFFAILAVIRNIYNSSKKGGPADLKSVAKDTIKAFVLLIITPMLAIVGIIASNTILKVLYEATNTSNSTSLSTQLFSASSTAANSYRQYAQTGKRIPITFDFTKEKEILEYYQREGVEITNEFRNFITSGGNMIYYTQQIFENETFREFNVLNDVLSHGTGAVEGNVTEYYGTFDRSHDAFEALSNDSSKPVDVYKRVQAYKPEYFVMADVVDFCIESSNSVYFKTIEEVLDDLSDVEIFGHDDTLFNTTVSMYRIQFLNDDLKQILPAGSTANANQVVSSQNSLRKIYKSDECRVIRYVSTYYDAYASAEPDRKMDIQYNHVCGEVDEINGAKYIIAVEQAKMVNNVRKTYYYPLTLGFASGNEKGFDSDYIQRGQMISAKGIFSEGKFPTAITQKDESEVQFYRENITDITVGNTGSVASGSLSVEEEKDEGGGGVFSAIGSFFKKLVSMFNPVANLKFNDKAIVSTYDSAMVTVNVLASGKLSISYMFSDALTSGIGAAVNGVRSLTSGGSETEQLGVFGLNLSNLFIPNKINMLILVVGAFLLLKITFTAIFMLINRAYELFLIIVIYPTACATIPFDDGGYKQWTKAYTQRLFSTYGLVLGINFVLMLFPIISEIEFFTAGEIALSKPLMRFRNLFNSTAKIVTFGEVQNAISIEFLKDFLNLVVVILFELVAFTLIETVPDTITQITGASKVQGVNPIESMGKVLKVAMGITKTIFTGIGGIKDILFAMIPTKNNKSRDKIKQKIKERADKAVEGLKGAIPGSEIVRSAKDMKYMHDKKKDQKEAMGNLKEMMKDGEKDPKKVQEAFNAVLKTQEAYTAAVNDPRGSRKAEEKEMKEQEKMGLSSREGDDDDDATSDEKAEHKSKRQLKKEKKRSDAIVKRLEKKAKKEGLSKEEQAALQKHTKISQQRENQMNSRVSKDDYEKAQSQVQALEALKSSGQTLTPDQQAELDAAQATVQKYETVKKNTSIKGRVTHSIDMAKQGRAERKRQEQSAEMFKAFRRFDGKSKAAQASYLASLESSMASSQAAFAAANGKTEDWDKIFKDGGFDEKAYEAFMKDDNVSKLQKDAVEAYRASQKLKGDLLAVNAEAHQSQARKEQNMRNYRNRNYNPAGMIRKRLLASQNDNDQQQLTELEQQIQAIKDAGLGSSNIGRYNELMQQKGEIEARTEYYKANGGKTRKEAKQQQANQRQRQIWERQAMEELEYYGKDPYDPAEIEKIVQRKRQEFLDKKKKKQGK